VSQSNPKTIGRADRRLHLMMFLEYASKGIWFPIAARFLSAGTEAGGLGFSDAQIGLIIAIAGSVGAICAPFIAGQLCDRRFSTERFMAVLLLSAGVIKICMAYQTTFSAWLILATLNAIVYMPTISLTNSLAMTHLSDPKRQFPAVRVWGTIGWIAVAWAFPVVWLQTDVKFQWLPPFFSGQTKANAPGLMIDSLKFAGLISIAFGLYCGLALPRTPPKRDAVRKLAFLEAFRLVRYRSFALLLGVALLISVVHTVYFMQTSKFLAARGLDDAYIMPAMSIGQFAEIAFMAVAGIALARFGYRRVLALGAFCYFLRYAIFGVAGLPLEAIVVAQFLHGPAFAFFIAAAFIYVDALAPKDVRHSAQTVFVLVLLGVGPVLAGWLNGFLSQQFTPEGGALDYARFWQTLALIALAATVVLALLFRDESTPTTGLSPRT
jgi:nucleoside transporter